MFILFWIIVLLMISALGLIILLAARGRELSRFSGVLLLLGYPVFVILVLTIGSAKTIHFNL